MCRLLCALLAVSVVVPFTRAASPLSNDASAFIRSQAESPVKWMRWGDAAFARAREEQKPIFVSIGTFTSELSRAMARQTFSNAETATFLNENFVCVLIDAKEQPQLAALYQSYIQGVKQLRGLPLNIWLTPELKPLEGANYLPPTEEWGKEGFSTVTKRVASGWKADPAAQRTKAEESASTIAEAQPTSPAEPIDSAGLTTLLTESKEAWAVRFDATNGGFGDPPKYPEPELLRWMLLDPSSREMALTTLRAICGGALRDPLDGGFFRYVVDAEWRQPYFQKTLADQARLTLTLLDAAKVTGELQFGDAAREALHYALTHLRLPDGDLSAAEDATSETLTTYYLWKASEIKEILGEKTSKDFFDAYGVTAEGNIPPDTYAGIATAGENFLRPSTTAKNDVTAKTLQESRAKLLAKRLQRTRPLLEDNATSGAHGLLLQALSRAGAQLKDTQLQAAAAAEAAFIRERLVLPDGTLRRVAGRTFAASPEDYAFVIGGLEEFKRAGKGSAETLGPKLLHALATTYWEGRTRRFVISASQAESAFWTRVVAPTPLPSDLPATESALLAAVSSGLVIDGAHSELASSLVPLAAERAKQAEDIARGDVLLALALASTAQKAAGTP